MLDGLIALYEPDVLNKSGAEITDSVQEIARPGLVVPAPNRLSLGMLQTQFSQRRLASLTLKYDPIQEAVKAVIAQRFDITYANQPKLYLTYHAGFAGREADHYQLLTSLPEDCFFKREEEIYLDLGRILESLNDEPVREDFVLTGVSSEANGTVTINFSADDFKTEVGGFIPNHSTRSITSLGSLYYYPALELLCPGYTGILKPQRKGEDLPTIPFSREQVVSEIIERLIPQAKEYILDNLPEMPTNPKGELSDLDWEELEP